jgi:hypothetical protein
LKKEMLAPQAGPGEQYPFSKVVMTQRSSYLKFQLGIHVGPPFIVPTINIEAELHKPYLAVEAGSAVLFERLPFVFLAAVPVKPMERIFFTQ